MRSPLDLLLAPRSVAVVGASRREDALGTAVVRNLRSLGFDGTLQLVNPRYDEIDGMACYPSLSALPAVPDAVFVALPADAGPDVVEEAGALGVKAAYVNASGYADGGDDGQRLQERLQATASRFEMAICGPNNTGAINFRDQVAMWTAPMPSAPRGSASIVSQSGSVSMVLAEGPRALGLSYMISAGNEAVLSVADYLEWLAGAEGVGVVVLFLETIRNPEKFVTAATLAADRGLPVVAMKIGRSEAGRAVVKAHTGSLAGDDAAYDAFFRRCGVVRARDLDELIEMANLFGTSPRPPAGGVAAVTLSGGEAALVADMASDVGLELPRLAPATVSRLGAVLPGFASPQNPLDAFGLGFVIDSYATMIEALLEDESLASVVAMVDAPAFGGIDADYAVEIARRLVELQPRTKKVLAMVNTSAGAGLFEPLLAEVRGTAVPVLTGLRESVAALVAWTRQRGLERPAEPALADIAAMSSSEVEWMGELARLGVAVAPTVSVDAVEGAVAAAERIGFPVAVKGTAYGLLHKSDAGLVSVDLRSSEEVALAAEHIWAAISGLDRPAIIVQRMVIGGAEIFVGVRTDPSFGQLVVVGPGGLLVELIDDVAVRIGPVSEASALEMLQETSAWRLLERGEGRARRDVAAASRLIANFSQVAHAARASVRTIEANPVIVLDEGQGAFCVDLVVQQEAS